VRDVGRVLEMPYSVCDNLSKMIPFNPVDPWSLDRTLENEPAFKERYDTDEEIHALIDLARPLEGLTRNIGMHAGGVIIARGKLTDYTPLYCQPGSESSVVSQYDKGDVEDAGLVKFDFLGLRNLTILDWAERYVREFNPGKRDFDLMSLPLDDAGTYELLCSANTTAVFQLEGRGMKELLKSMQPNVFEDLIALLALFRPGPLESGMVVDFVNRKHGRAKVDYFHPDLEPVLKSTYGVIVYQEQVMLISQIIGGYSLGGADLLRRAMGKKKPEAMAKHRVIFREGAEGNGAPQRPEPTPTPQHVPKNSWCSRRTTSGPSSSRTTNVMLIAEAPWEITSTLAGWTARKSRAASPGVVRMPMPTTAMIAR